jgi:hypothetical protein
VSGQVRTVADGRAHAEFLRRSADEIAEPAMNLDEVELDADAAYRLAIGSAGMIDGLCDALETADATARRLTMERDGARHALEESQRVRIAQSLDLAAARAEVVPLRAALDPAHRLVRRHGAALAAMEEGREAEESGT